MRQAFLIGFLLAGPLAGLVGAASAAEAPASVTVLVAYHSATGHTEKMAQGVVEGAARIPGTRVVLKRVGDVAAGDLLSADAVVVGSPVYWSNMSGDVKKFFDDWQLKFGIFPGFKMRDKVGAAFATGGQVSRTRK